ncbi:hypothetical protein HanRHA438_Chr00c04g0845121 [Helianthus annuus]|nr:hypothetical protein HanIR_Chr03g0110481 [Helianthus annuus]KAJ0954960.1 hypothetical protein HanRHA438_Chr00c04g0845121 [Helianthus annuus]
MIDVFGNKVEAHMSEELNLICSVEAATLEIKFSCVRTTPCTYKLSIIIIKPIKYLKKKL